MTLFEKAKMYRNFDAKHGVFTAAFVCVLCWNRNPTVLNDL